MERAAAGTFASVGLELGGKDPAYVCDDVKLEHAVDNLVDGAFFNSGQCCCGIERIYVHEKLYAPFVEGFVDLTGKYVFGNPLDPETTIGPMARRASPTSCADRRARRCARAPRRISTRSTSTDFGRLALSRAAGADRRRPSDGGDARGKLRAGDRHHEGARRRRGDRADERQPLRADGLGLDHRPRPAAAIGDRIETGTFFMNRCDYLDPALTWTGVKDTGRGAVAVEIGYRGADPAEDPITCGELLRMTSPPTPTGTIRPPSASARGGIAELADACKAAGIRQPLLVTDPGLAKLAITRARARRCMRAGLTRRRSSPMSAEPGRDERRARHRVFRGGQA